MHKIIILVISSILCYISGNAQKKKHIINALVLGCNYTYISENNKVNGVNYGSIFREHTLAANMAIDLGNHIRIGVDAKRIFVKANYSSDDDYLLIGAFTQYKVKASKNSYAFGELGYYKGNYCTCGNDIPYKKEGIRYISFGGGYNTKLYKNFRLDLAFTNAQTLVKVIKPYAYTQYIIGLDYVLPLRK